MAKGGGKGKGGGVENDKNTIRSKARARIVEVISEGEIEGIVGGAKGIYFEETAVQNDNGTFNFKNVHWEERTGLPDQEHLNGHTTVETPYQVEARVKKDNGPVVRTITEQNADAARVIVRIPALAKQDKDNGSIVKTNVEYCIDVRPYQGSWQQAVQVQILEEKTTSAYQRAHRVALPLGGHPWDIRVRRITEDAEDETVANETWFDSYTVLVEGKFTYPNTACCYIEVNAEDMGQSIPSRRFRVRGIKVMVPSNYDPLKRTYTGIWDGTFKKAWTNNPAWVFYDLLVNDRYGLGEFVQPAVVDKWSLYQIAQYCDELIPSGYHHGETGEPIMEPRFTFNGQIVNRQEAHKLLSQIATAWRGMAFWSLGQVFATADLPSDPVKLVTPANVINGEFNYSSTAQKARHSVALVAWNDPADMYRPTVEAVINDESLELYGWREKNLELLGCTSRGLAHRYGKWALDVEQNENETVEYTAGWDHMDVRPGEIIAIADPAKAQIRLGGRTKSALTESVVLDFPFVPAPGENYTIMVTLPDGTIEQRGILEFLDEQFDEEENSLGFVKVNVDQPFTQVPAVNSMWIITGSDVVPRQYRVLAVSEEDKHLFKIHALFHDPTKYARIERDIFLEKPPYKRPNAIPSMPEGLRLEETHYLRNGVPRSTGLLSWSNAGDFLIREYEVAMVTPSGGYTSLGKTQKMSMEIDNLEPGEYRFEVVAINFAGTKSPSAELIYTVSGWTASAPPTVSDLQEAEYGGANFHGRDVRIQWVNNFASTSNPLSTGATPSDKPSPFYAGNTVRVYDNATGDLLRRKTVHVPEFTYTYEMNKADCAKLSRAPTRALRFEVSVSDTIGRESLPDVLVLTNEPPAMIVPTVVANGNFVHVQWTNPDDRDLAGVKIWMEKELGYDPAGTAPIYDGYTASVMLPVDENSTYYLRMGGYDLFGDEGMLICPEIRVDTYQFIDLDPPAKPNGLNLSTRLETIPGVGERLMLEAEVNAAGEDDFAYYDFEVKAEGGNWVAFQGSEPRYEWSVLPTTTYTVKARAVDKTGNFSFFSDEQQITTPAVASLAHLINTGNTEINANRIKVSGATTLADWRRGGDETRIDGGAISANTITANKLTVGQRNITTTGIEFEHNKPTNDQVSWSAGKISYIGDANIRVEKSVSAGSASWSEGTLYIYWTKNAAALSATEYAAVAFHQDNIVLAAYRGGKLLDANFGRTIIDGSSIKTGTVDANQITAGAIGSSKIAAGAVRATHIAAGAVSADKIAGGVITSTHVSDGAIGQTQIAGGAITVTKIADGAVSQTKIAGGSITTSKIAATAITSDKIASNAVKANNIAANAVTADKINVTSLDAISANLGTIKVGSAHIGELAVGRGNIQSGAVTVTNSIWRGDMYHNQSFTLTINPSSNGQMTMAMITVKGRLFASGEGNYTAIQVLKGSELIGSKVQHATMFGAFASVGFSLTVGDLISTTTTYTIKLTVTENSNNGFVKNMGEAIYAQGAAFAR